jgi:hypothetical protein
MAGHARFTALLDACVIHPVAVIDSLLSAAHLGLYAPKWTTRIEQEWMKSLEVRTGQPQDAFLRRRDAIRDACPDWEVPEVAWAQLIPSLVLPDPNDVHVLAAAIAGHADCIVTGNLKDFPDDVLAPFGISAIHPDEFLVAQMDLDEIGMLGAFKRQRERLRRPELGAEAFADALARNGLVATAQRLRDAVDLI